GKGPVHYRCFSWNEFRDIAREIACGLHSLGIGKGDIVAIHSETRAEFYLCDLGVLANGSISAALYTSLPLADHVKTIATAEPRALIVEDAKAVLALQRGGAGVSGMKWIVMTGLAPEDAMTLEGLRELGRSAIAGDPGLFERIRSEVAPGDL